uniref:Uncharacterized protein n=1 Tax=Rhizophora mucronata TaxID=61149 RepID=A0A2P2IN23_RHIMU
MPHSCLSQNIWLSPTQNGPERIEPGLFPDFSSGFSNSGNRIAFSPSRTSAWNGPDPMLAKRNAG